MLPYILVKFTVQYPTRSGLHPYCNKEGSAGMRTCKYMGDGCTDRARYDAGRIKPSDFKKTVFSIQDREKNPLGEITS
jgi:hypothetical protein